MKVIFATVTSLLWGASNLLEKIAVDGVPLSLTFLAFGVVAMAMAGVMMLWDHRHIVSFVRALASSAPKRHAIISAMAGAAASALGTLTFFMALKRCDEAHIVSAIAYTAPVFTLLLGRWFMAGATKIIWPHVVAMALIVVGVIIVVSV